MIVDAPSGSILVCAATRWEAEPIASRLRSANSSARILKTGMGSENAARALLALPAQKFSLVISAGFAGALKPEIAPGSVVADAEGAPSEIRQSLLSSAQKTGAKLYFGAIADSARVLAPAQKKALGETADALAVDMETQAIRSWARERGAPVLALRVVLDGVNEELPAKTPSGEDALSLALFALANAPRLGRLLSLGARQKRAMKALADLLEDFLPRL